MMHLRNSCRFLDQPAPACAKNRLLGFHPKWPEFVHSRGKNVQLAIHRQYEKLGMLMLRKALSNVDANLFSDSVNTPHGLTIGGWRLARCRRPGSVPAPHLSGVWGQRLYFLHDGRTSDLLKAIEAHASPEFGGANAVIQMFNSLSQSQQQDLHEFPALSLCLTCFAYSAESKAAASIETDRRFAFLIVLSSAMFF